MEIICLGDSSWAVTSQGEVLFKGNIGDCILYVRHNKQHTEHKEYNGDYKTQ
jgi:hypothetical protein